MSNSSAIQIHLLPGSYELLQSDHTLASNLLLTQHNTTQQQPPSLAFRCSSGYVILNTCVEQGGRWGGAVWRRSEQRRPPLIWRRRDPLVPGISRTFHGPLNTQAGSHKKSASVLLCWKWSCVNCEEVDRSHRVRQ
jgi:hypothetical protein